jgi:two-component system chemotaxis response regulator CheB
MPGRDIIVVGASAGGVEPLRTLVAGLPADLPAALFVVLHVPPDDRSLLPEILSRSGPLPASHAHEGERIGRGRIYVAPPDFHLLVQPGRVYLSHGPRENHHRPAIDALFRSAASAYGPGVIAVVLSGMLYDGTAGMLAVRRAGGVGVVQDPADALMPFMPQSALRVAGADLVLPVAGMPGRLAELVRQPLPEGGDVMKDPMDEAPEVNHRVRKAQVRGERAGQPSLYACPECGGVLFQLEAAKPVRFRCSVGHSYYAEGLLAEQTAALEAALWTAVRTFLEKATLARQLADRERGAGHAALAKRFEEQAQTADYYGDLIQKYLLQKDHGPAEGPKPPAPDAGGA